MNPTNNHTHPMNHLETHLRARRDNGRKLLVPYMTAGLCDNWQAYVEEMVTAGADAVEIGIPFSDPIMDGPTIQQASQQALDRGTTPTSAFDGARELDVDVPLVAMTYYNLAYRAGVERFAHSIANAGLAGCILPDIPLEESGDWRAAAHAHHVAPVMLAAPTASDERLARICAEATGFVYGVGLVGVTGERATLSESATEIAARLKPLTDTPVIVGIGISTPAHAAEVGHVADGVVVASAIIRRILDGASVEAVGEQVRELRAALDSVSTAP
jgi:tryptophan synthase alpha chain